MADPCFRTLGPGLSPNYRNPALHLICKHFLEKNKLFLVILCNIFIAGRPLATLLFTSCYVKTKDKSYRKLGPENGREGEGVAAVLN